MHILDCILLQGKCNISEVKYIGLTIVAQSGFMSSFKSLTFLVFELRLIFIFYSALLNAHLCILSHLIFLTLKLLDAVGPVAVATKLSVRVSIMTKPLYQLTGFLACILMVDPEAS